MSKWISVEDRLPEQIVAVLLVVYGNIRIGFYDGQYYRYGEVKYLKHEVTHWTPLPKPPKEE